MKDYAEEFDHLVAHNNLNKPKEQLVMCFTDGLRTAITNQVVLRTRSHLYSCQRRPRRILAEKHLKKQRYSGYSLLNPTSQSKGRSNLSKMDPIQPPSPNQPLKSKSALRGQLAGRGNKIFVATSATRLATSDQNATSNRALW